MITKGNQSDVRRRDSTTKTFKPRNAVPQDNVDRPPKPLTRAAMLAARHWHITLVLWIALLGAGAYAYFDGLDREGFPAIDTPYAIVNAVYFADDPEIVDRDVTQPISTALLEVDGIISTESYASANRATIFVELESGTSSVEGVDLIMDVHEGIVPESVDVMYTPLLATKYLNRYDLLVSVVPSQDISIAELQTQATAIADYLGESEHISAATVEWQIEEATDPATGELTERQTSFARTYEAGDPGFTPTILVGVERANTGLDVLEFSAAVTASLKNAPLTSGTEARISADFAKDINYQLDSLQRNLLTGLIAVALVCLLLIGWRVALVTAAFMVTVLAASLTCLLLVGQSLNTITLFALILTLGLLVDDAIVIAESIDANRHVGGGPINVVRVAIDRVGTASFSGTLTTVLVFMPMLFISGILGDFIRIMPITVIITLLCSFVLSIVFISMTGRLLLLRGKVPSNPVIRGEKSAARFLRRTVSLIERNRSQGLLVAAGAVGLSLVFVFLAFQTLGGLTVNIFPPAKDSNTIIVIANFDDETDLAGAEAISDEVDATILAIAGNMLESASYYGSGAGGSNIELQLSDFKERSTTAAALSDLLEAELNQLDGGEFTVRQVDNGPPADEFPWAVQINAEANPAAAQTLAEDIVVELNGATITRANGETATMVEAKISTTGQVVRFDADRTIEVRGRFDADDTTALTGASEDKLHELFPENELVARGLEADAFSFYYGQESDSQESFGSTLVAMYVALAAMLVLLIVQFRSLVQPLLILLAIPFGLFGVSNALTASNNPLSFFVMIGLIGLIGIAVNNTILLTDAANQEWRMGASNTESIASAIQSRFRPLVATTATTVVGLAPLAVSDPFWEPLALTIMFGLISSTVLVLVAFPFYYLLLVPPGRILFAKLRRS